MKFVKRHKVLFSIRGDLHGFDCVALFGVTEEPDASQDPVVRVFVGPQQQREDVGQIGTPRLLVDGTLVQVVALGAVSVDGEHVRDGQRRVQHFRRGFDQARITTIPARAIQVQTVHIHSCRKTDTGATLEGYVIIIYISVYNTCTHLLTNKNYNVNANSDTSNYFVSSKKLSSEMLISPSQKLRHGIPVWQHI